MAMGVLSGSSFATRELASTGMSGIPATTHYSFASMPQLAETNIATAALTEFQ
jgi:hypothetical protein